MENVLGHRRIMVRAEAVSQLGKPLTASGPARYRIQADREPDSIVVVRQRGCSTSFPYCKGEKSQVQPPRRTDLQLWRSQSYSVSHAEIGPGRVQGVQPLVKRTKACRVLMETLSERRQHLARGMLVEVLHLCP